MLRRRRSSAEWEHRGARGSRREAVGAGDVNCACLCVFICPLRGAPSIWDSLQNVKAVWCHFSSVRVRYRSGFDAVKRQSVRFLRVQSDALVSVNCEKVFQEPRCAVAPQTRSVCQLWGLKVLRVNPEFQREACQTVLFITGWAK